MSSALRIIMSCYQDSSATDHQPVSAGEQDASGLGTVVQEYLALRSAWESREARSLAAWMTERYPAEAGDAVATTSSVGVEQAPVVPATRQRVLVVDDSPDLLIVACAFLRDFGFDVVHAASAEAATLTLTDGAPVDLLVTDYAMPGMNGIDLVVQAREWNPQQRALIITGYADSSVLMNLPEGVAVLAKPFRRAALYKCIFSIIGALVQSGDVASTTQESAPAPSPAVT